MVMAMDYEKAYKDALEKAREWYNNPNSSSIGKAYLYAIFPELKENEDERMRNIAIYACKYMINNFENSTKQYEDAIVWLEKQGKNNSCKFTFEDVLALECSMRLAKITEYGDRLYEILVPLYNKIHNAYLVEKQCEQKSRMP